MSCHLVTCLPEEGLTLNHYQHPTCASPIETEAITDGLSNLIVSILQGTKVGPAKEHDQYMLIPQRVNAFFSKQSYQISRKLGILQQISTFPCSIHILNKHPRQSWPKDCSPAVYQHSMESFLRYNSKIPQESPI